MGDPMTGTAGASYVDCRECVAANVCCRVILAYVTSRMTESVLLMPVTALC